MFNFSISNIPRVAAQKCTLFNFTSGQWFYCKETVKLEWSLTRIFTVIHIPVWSPRSCCCCSRSCGSVIQVAPSPVSVAILVAPSVFSVLSPAPTLLPIPAAASLVPSGMGKVWTTCQICEWCENLSKVKSILWEHWYLVLDFGWLSWRFSKLVSSWISRLCTFSFCTLVIPSLALHLLFSLRRMWCTSAIIFSRLVITLEQGRYHFRYFHFLRNHKWPLPLINSIRRTLAQPSLEIRYRDYIIFYMRRPNCHLHYSEDKLLEATLPWVL